MRIKRVERSDSGAERLKGGKEEEHKLAREKETELELERS